MAVGFLSLGACTRDKSAAENADSTAATESSATTTTTTSAEQDYEAEYRDRANRLATRMATDYKIDTASQSRVRQVYYKRARRIAEIRSKYNMTGNTVSGGVDTTAYFGEIQALDQDIDREFQSIQSILSPEQYKTYESNRTTYWGEDDMNRDVDVDGDETTVETGDIKVKAEPGKSKVETSTYESKIKGDERKYKSGDTKIKSEPGKTKIETGDTKIKIKDKD
jgi:hypothetical protein